MVAVAIGIAFWACYEVDSWEAFLLGRESRNLKGRWKSRCLSKDTCCRCGKYECLGRSLERCAQGHRNGHAKNCSEKPQLQKPMKIVSKHSEPVRPGSPLFSTDIYEYVCASEHGLRRRSSNPGELVTPAPSHPRFKSVYSPNG